MSIIQSPQRIQGGSPIRLQSLPPQAMYIQQAPIMQQLPMVQTIAPQQQQFQQQPSQTQLLNSQSPKVVSSKVDYPEEREAAKASNTSSSACNTNAPCKCKSLDWLLCLIPMLFALIVLIASAWFLSHLVKTENLKESQGVIAFVNRNQESFPFTALTQVLADKACPEGFELAHLGEWQGVEDGCLCEGDKEKHRSATCLIKSKCYSVNEVSKKDLDFWIREIEPVNTPIPVKVCAKRASTFTKMNSPGICPENFRTCGSFGCVGKDQLCPLNKVQKLAVYNEGVDVNVLTVQKEFYQFSYTTEDLQPFVGFEITSSKAPCFDQKFQPEFPSKKWYPYARQPERGCDEKFGMSTPYFEELGSLTEKTVFNQNKIEETIKALPFSQEYFAPETDRLYWLVEKRIYSSNDKLCDKLNEKGVDHIEEYATKLQKIERGFAIFFIIFCSIMLIIGIAFALMFFIKGLSKNPTKILYILLIIGIIMCIIFWIVYLCKVNTLQNASDQYQVYQDKKCFKEAQINDAFKSITSHSTGVISEYKQYAWWLFWVSVVFFVLAIIAIFLKKRQNAVEKRNEAQIFEKPWN